VRLAAEGDRLRGAHAESERRRAGAEDANAELTRERAALELANQQLQDQAAELELQAEELHATAAQLEERTAEAEALAERLRASEVHGRAVFAHAAVGMGRVSFADARWLDVNDAFCRMLGYGREALMATPWPAITHPDDLDLDLVPFRRMAEGELEAYAVEKRFIHGAGHHVWARLTLSLVRDAGGRPDYEIAVIEDITERRKAEAERERLLAALGAERARLTEVFRQAPVAVVVVRGRVAADLVYELANPRYLEMLPPGSAPLGRRMRDVLPAMDAALLGVLQHVLDTGEPFLAADYLVPLDRDGDGVPEDYYFSFVYHPLVEPDGAVGGVVGVGTEVTDSVRARRDTEAARARTEAVLGSIADAFYLLDREWRFTHVNDAAQPLLQTTREALIGRTLWEAFPGVVGSVFERPYREAMATGRVTSAEAYFAPLATWFDVRTYPWAGGLMVHFRDVGARKAAEAERERLLADAEAARAEAEAARARAEAASRAKSEFLAVMSHELRTPLNAIGGYAELLELGIRGPVTDQQREDLARIQRSQRALLGLINEVLNYARLDAGAVRYDLADVPVAEAVGAAEVLVAPQLRAKGLGYAWAGCDPGLAVRADRDKLQQVLLNLLSNAIKFTNARAGLPGRVEVSCEAGDAAGPAAAATVRIRVRDTGVGIPADQLGRVFEPFVQVDQGLTRTQQGTGLGLAISRDLARGMGGDLTAESTPGVGSTFTVTLPRA
jgi:PAS domain S-box-containing protein